MKLNINNEFGKLKEVVVCLGTNIPIYEEYRTNDPEFLKYHPYSWDKELLLKQQEQFFNVLSKYNVNLVFPETRKELIWQMYTRDTAFVIKDKLYYSSIRKLGARNGEIDSLMKALKLENDQVLPIDNEIEGGDVLVEDIGMIYIGHGSRTSQSSIDFLSNSLKVKSFELGQNVMHLDTRLTLLPKQIALVNISAFLNTDLDFLRSQYKIIEVQDSETKKLGTNVFVINPETVIVPNQHVRIAKEIESFGLKVELVDYTEPINLGGSFRCTTLPLLRE